MAAHTGQPTRSRRFIKVYLGTWGLLAVGALGYLAMLAYPPQAGAPPQAAIEPPQVAVKPLRGAGEPQPAAEPQQVEVEPRRVPVVPVHAPVKPVKREAPAFDTAAESSGRPSKTHSEPHTDAARSQDPADEPVTNVQTRPSALKEPVSTADALPPPPTVPGITVLDKPGDRPGDSADTAVPSSAEPARNGPGKVQATAAPPPATPPPVVPIETGSISPNSASVGPEATSVMPKQEIVFGEPVVTRSVPEFAVQLGAGPSLPALRRSWGQLAKRHADALGSLQPRVVEPRSGSSLYRLLAGPVSTKADAERICTELGVGPEGCYVTYYAGAPL